MTSYIAKITRAGCVYKTTYSLGTKTLHEFSTPQGISMAVDVAPSYGAGRLVVTPVAYRRSTVKSIDKQTLLEVLRESNGMCCVLVLDGPLAFLTTGASVPRFDNNQSINGEDFELADAGNDTGRPRSIPVITSADFDASPAECIKLCDRVASRLSARMLRNIITSSERVDAARDMMMTLSLEYSDKRESAVERIVSDVRSARAASNVTVVQKREHDLEVLHSHARQCLAACEAMEWYNITMTKHLDDTATM